MKTPCRFLSFGMRLSICLSVWISGLGCGQKAYEERLQQSRLFYEYLQSVEDHLSLPAWNRSDVSMSMRLPKPFQSPMAGPEVFQSPDGEETYGQDPRQENVLGTMLPGLVEGWAATIDSNDGEPDAWIYVLSNHDRFQNSAGGGPQPKDFFTDLESDLMRIFQVTIPEGESTRGEKNSRTRSLLPARGSSRAQYTTPKDYTVIHFVPGPDFDPPNLEASLYERKSGDIKAAVLVVTRSSTSAQFRQRLEMALETLEVGSEKPLRKKPGSSSSGTSRSNKAPAF